MAAAFNLELGLELNYRWLLKGHVVWFVSDLLSGCFILEPYWTFNKMWFLSVNIIYQSHVISEHHNCTSSFVVVYGITLSLELGLGLALLDEILPNKSMLSPIH